MKLMVKLLRPGAKAPVRAHDDDSGLDAFACIERPLLVWLKPVKVPLGIACELDINKPDARGPRGPCSWWGFEIQVRPRSGLSLKGAHVVLGTVDDGYRGELCATMWSLFPRRVRHGDKVCQLVVAPVVRPAVEFSTGLSDTRRGDRGYGSTDRGQP